MKNEKQSSTKPFSNWTDALVAVADVQRSHAAYKHLVLIDSSHNATAKAVALQSMLLFPDDDAKRGAPLTIHKFNHANVDENVAVDAIIYDEPLSLHARSAVQKFAARNADLFVVNKI